MTHSLLIFMGTQITWIPAEEPRQGTSVYKEGNEAYFRTFLVSFFVTDNFVDNVTRLLA